MYSVAYTYNFFFSFVLVVESKTFSVKMVATVQVCTLASFIVVIKIFPPFQCTIQCALKMKDARSQYVV